MPEHSTEFLPYTSEDRFRLELADPQLGRYVIDVSLPPNRVEGATYPLVMALDGHILFDPTATALHGGSGFPGSVTAPPSIVVGVGYPHDEGIVSMYGRRHFDFHGPWDMSDELGRDLDSAIAEVRALEGKPDYRVRAGGAEMFSSFLVDTVFPLLADRFPVDLAARHTLVGVSSGGHFVLRSLYDPNAPFSRYVCISGAFGTANGAIEKLEGAYAAKHDDMDVDLFICCGDIEVTEHRIHAMCRIGSGVLWIAEQFAIRGWKSARVTWEVMKGESHVSIVARAIATGLRTVHGHQPGRSAI